MKERNCRMTPQEKETHKLAGKYRRMTDAQLVELISGLERRAEKAESKAYILAAQLEEAQNSSVTNQSAPESSRDGLVEEIITLKDESREIDVKDAVGRLIDCLGTYAGRGYGIGNGTIAKIRRIAEKIPTETFTEIFFGEANNDNVA